MQIRIENLSKFYGEFAALQDITLSIGQGMFGLLGPNGAGKTTLMRILATLMPPSSGRVTVAGMDLQKERARIRAMLGYLPQDFSSLPRIKTWEFLDYMARLSGVTAPATRKRAVDAMLERVGLFDARDRLANRLSGGMKRRLGIAQALIGSAKIIIVDEPTTGLDPEERIRFRNLLAELSRQETIILLSTHIVGDISSTCQNMALLQKGRLAFLGAPEEIVELARGKVWLVHATDAELSYIKEKYPVIATLPSQKGWEVQIVGDSLDGLTGVAIEPTLEHAYVYFMEHHAGGNA